MLLEGRYFAARQSGIPETGVLATAYRQFGPNMMLGLGYNFGNVSEDLTDLAIDDQGMFLTLVRQFQGNSAFPLCCKARMADTVGNLLLAEQP